VRENLTRFRRLERLLDQLRAELDRLRDERRDRTNGETEATSRRARLESDLAAARERRQAAATSATQSRQAAAEACGAPPPQNEEACSNATQTQSEAEDDERDADNDVQQRQDELDDAERDELENRQEGNNLDFAIQVLETRIAATETDDARAKQDLDTSKATVRQYTTEVTNDRTSLREARRRLGSARDTLINGIARARQQVDQARSSLASSEASLGVTLANGRVDEQPADAAQLAAGRAAVASAESSVEEAHKALEDTVLRAPTDGVAGRVDAEVGDLVGGGAPSSASSRSSAGSPPAGAGSASSAPTPGASGAPPGGGSPSPGSTGGTGQGAQPGGGSMGGTPGSSGGAGASGGSSGSQQGGVVTLAQVDQLEVKVDFSETDAARLRNGDDAEVVVDALPDKRIPAHVASIDPIDTTVNGVVSYEVTMLLDREVAGLKPGMTATADAVVNRADRTLTVPRTAVRSPEGANPSVTVIGPGGRQELRLVATGVQDDSKVQILAGVGLGERVVRTIAAPPDPGMAQ
jgi:multidrug efflux pump subunit AcrA (membrane-fusion protein)